MQFEELKGKTLTNIKGEVGGDVIIFTTDKGEQYKLFHIQDCCESVEIEDICGDFEDLIGSPILVAEEVSGDEKNLPEVEQVKLQLKGWSDEWGESYTWTFYKLDTANGGVTIRWYGSSNGYYSESVSFIKIGE